MIIFRCAKPTELDFLTGNLIVGQMTFLTGVYREELAKLSVLEKINLFTI